MSKPVRFGVIGAGGMGCTTMLDIMAGHPAARPVAFYEIDPARPDTAGRIPRLIQAGIHQCASLSELLARQDVDVILNCTPHYAHAEITIAALKAGHAVLCEKPPASTADQCQAMIDAPGRPAGCLWCIFSTCLGLRRFG
jgi:predicted dehydrogenase